MSDDVKLTLAILQQHERLIRCKARLIARGIPEAEVGEDAASWIYINAIFDINEGFIA